MEVPSTSKDENLQDRYNRELSSEINRLREAVSYIKAIPDTLTTVEEITTYLRSTPWQ